MVNGLTVHLFSYMYIESTFTCFEVTVVVCSSDSFQKTAYVLYLVSV